MRLRNALHRFRPVEQVWRAPMRRPVQHIHHQHHSSTTLQVQVAVGVRIASASHPIRVLVVSHTQGPGPAAAAATYPVVVFRDRLAPAAPVAAARQTARQSLPHVHRASPPVTSTPAASAARAQREAPPRVELVHRLPTPSALEAATNRPADARMDPTASWPGSRRAAPGAPTAPGVTPLTAADVPGVVDQVVREIDRRVVAARERRGWTS